jgi:cytochrome bd-type quinol oxidase subunit 2
MYPSGPLLRKAGITAERAALAGVAIIAMAKASRTEESLDKQAEAAIEEARMVLPGIQALFGFQLIAGFNQGFSKLSAVEQNLHYVSLVLVTLAIAIIMTPAAYHRIVEQGSVSLFFVRLISWLIAVAMVPLMVALGLEVYVVGTVVLEERTFSAIVAGVLVVILAALWFGFPFAMRNRKLP